MNDFVLHILKGDVPEALPGTVLGHEAVAESRTSRSLSGRPDERT
ncbi:hypothetical protein [Streptomyces turgidiscabies]|uniref:Uncharacterized protein n=1 Tax=Streptomyces turgidiscabies TaxID=85558 RepID=A0ABU0RTV5_9ACTN|nr:hypothetical protein [Streptomyces turgidiscabies]MDQ0935427.1 hypothetical protein [Streptomyces turgidiscabies]